KTVGAVRDQMEPEISPAISPIAEIEPLGNSPPVEIPQVGKLADDADDALLDDGDIRWNKVPDTAHIIPPQGMTAAFIEERTGDLIIAQDHMHLYERDVVVRINVTEVERFVDGLVAMLEKERS